MNFLTFIVVSLALSHCYGQQMLDFQQNDVNLLNYALTLEHLGATFWINGLNHFSPTDFANAGYNSSVYSYLSMIRDHESAHVGFLTSAIIARGGTPVPYCDYTFSYGDDIAAFTMLGAVIENTDVMAYDGAINTITELGLRTGAATIATIEGRHASYLNLLTGYQGSPFPAPFDNATLPAAILEIASQFQSNCNGTFALPVPANFSENLNVSDTNGAYENDVQVLQYALTLENLEANFYRTGLMNFDNVSFAAAGYNQTVYDYFMMILSHETTHQTFLSGLLGDQAVAECTYNFSLTYGNNVSAFIAIAQILENTGVTAYDGAVNAISNLAYLTGAATIATIEARHAAFINQLVGQYPWPGNFDMPQTPSAVKAAASAYIVSCPYDLSTINPSPANFSEAAIIGAFMPIASTSGVAPLATSGFVATTEAAGVINNQSSASLIVINMLAVIIAALVL